VGHTCCPIQGRDRLLPYLVLLRAGFAVPPSVATGAVRSYRTLSPLPAGLTTDIGGLLSVALSVGSRPPGITWHLALRSPDFPLQIAQRLPGRLPQQLYESPQRATRHQRLRSTTARDSRRTIACSLRSAWSPLLRSRRTTPQCNCASTACASGPADAGFCPVNTF
jgi:hypothetical protein